MLLRLLRDLFFARATSFVSSPMIVVSRCARSAMTCVSSLSSAAIVGVAIGDDVGARLQWFQQLRQLDFELREVVFQRAIGIAAPLRECFEQFALFDVLFDARLQLA